MQTANHRFIQDHSEAMSNKWDDAVSHHVARIERQLKKLPQDAAETATIRAAFEFMKDRLEEAQGAIDNFDFVVTTTNEDLDAQEHGPR